MKSYWRNEGGEKKSAQLKNGTQPSYQWIKTKNSVTLGPPTVNWGEGKSLGHVGKGDVTLLYLNEVRTGRRRFKTSFAKKPEKGDRRLLKKKESWSTRLVPRKAEGRQVQRGRKCDKRPVASRSRSVRVG